MPVTLQKPVSQRYYALLGSSEGPHLVWNLTAQCNLLEGECRSRFLGYCLTRYKCGRNLLRFEQRTAKYTR